MNRFLKSKRLYLLPVLPFLVVALVVLRRFLPGAMQSAVPVAGYLGWLPGWWKEVVEAGLLLWVVYFIFYLVRQYRLLYYPTALPSLLYILLVAGTVAFAGFDEALVAAVVLALAVGRLMSGIFVFNRNGALFDFGALVMLAVIIYPKSIGLVAWALFALPFSGRSSGRDVMALFIGFVLVLWFVVFYYFWTDRLDVLPDVFWNSVTSGVSFIHLPVVALIHLALLVLLAFVAMGQLSLHYVSLIVNHRRALLSLMSLFFFLLANFLLVPGLSGTYLYLFAVPLAILYAHYFISNSFRIVNVVVFLLLLITCILPCFI